ncbi:unnamed protein product [Brachionus calyciflorus]|uniref:Uncharacterized protein n=1 Tax=Brachionus calyciflorus TaxID=104777 RepID=A0A814FPX8_9BILA|nr:unnamed protein product [Brachionus calyciflorus]
MNSKINKLKIIDYYDNVKNQIDIECEKILANEKISSDQKKQCSLQRNRFLSEIDKISSYNLENFEKNNWDYELLKNKNLNAMLYADKFCFFISKQKLENGNGYPLGKLVITNFFICEDVQENLE